MKLKTFPVSDGIGGVVLGTTTRTDWADLVAEVIAPANSLRGALFRLQTRINLFDGHPIAYELMLRPGSYIRADLINMTTLPVSLTNRYRSMGGTNADPVLENLHGAVEPIAFDLRILCEDRNTRYFQNPFYRGLVEAGLPYCFAIPFQDAAKSCYGALTIFDSVKPDRRRRDAEDLLAIAAAFHRAVLASDLFAAYFGLTERELETLTGTASGQTAADLAELESLSPRTIEARLESARRKLMAKSTAEAVYKAATYRLISLM